MLKDTGDEPQVRRHWHELYIEKESDPYDVRNDKQFCEDNQLNYNSFCSWKGKYRTFIYREVEQRRKQYRNEHRSIGYKALMKKLLSGDTNAIKLHFQLLGDLVEKQEVKTENMSDADKIRRLQSLREEVLQREEAFKRASSKETPTDGPSDATGPLSPELRRDEPGTANLGPTDS